MTKQILIFIGLKIAEICGVCGIIAILYVVGMYVNKYVLINDVFPRWFLPIVGAVFLAIVCVVPCLVGIGIYHAIKSNWQWADRLSKKK